MFFKRTRTGRSQCAVEAALRFESLVRTSLHSSLRHRVSRCSLAHRKLRPKSILALLPLLPLNVALPLLLPLLLSLLPMLPLNVEPLLHAKVKVVAVAAEQATWGPSHRTLSWTCLRSALILLWSA